MERTLPNLFYEPNYYPHTKTRQSYAKQEKPQTIFLMNRDTKVLSKLLASGIQQWIKRIIGQALGTVYSLFEVPASHIRVLVRVSTTLLPVQFFTNTHPGRAGDSSSIWVPATTWETQIDFQAPGLGLASSGCYGCLGREPADTQSVSAFQIK